MGVSSHSHMNCRPAGTRFKSSFVLCGLQRGLAHGSQTSVTLAFRSWSISCHGLSPTGVAILENVHPIWYGPSCRLHQAPKHVTVVRTALKKIIPFDKNADLSKFCLQALFFIQSCYPHQPDNNMHPKHLWANFPPFLVRIVCGWDAVVNTTALEALSFSHRSNANFVYESMRFASHVANVHSEGWVVRLFSRNSLGPNHRRANLSHLQRPQKTLYNVGARAKFILLVLCNCFSKKIRRGGSIGTLIEKIFENPNFSPDIWNFVC